MMKSHPEFNWHVHRHVIDLFKMWERDGYRKNQYYQRLCKLAETLELPDNSPVHKILNCVKSPTEKQIKLVAMTLAKRALEVHFELM